MRYDPERPPSASDWLATDEQERLAAIEDYHRRRQIRLPNAAFHAIFHSIVENQLAMDTEDVVRQTLLRLQGEGLSRHDAVHAIGSVLAEDMFDMLKNKKTFSEADYARKLEALTADRWLKQ